MKNKKTIFDEIKDAYAKTVVNTDEQTDTWNESPDTTENPDKKTKSKKTTQPSTLVQDINFASESSIAKLEKAWNINQSKREEDSFIESNKKKSKAVDDPEEIVNESIEMSKASIKSIVKHANALMMGLNETNQSCLSEGWVASKITIIEDYLRAIHDYVMYYEEDEGEDEAEAQWDDNWNELTYEISVAGGVFYEDDKEKTMDGPVSSTGKSDNPKVKLNKPFRTPGGPKKFSVYVKNEKGNVVKVNFGDPNMSIKRDDPERRKSYRARHGCDNPGPKWKANYWSCKMWSNTNVSDLT